MTVIGHWYVSIPISITILGYQTVKSHSSKDEAHILEMVQAYDRDHQGEVHEPLTADEKEGESKSLQSLMSE